ncbi:molybdopterin-dependent oxidoreductase [Nocardioides sp. T2.26MG-1]|uniref:molybdopterin-dependent oxidoreductase n=1 Tax=Nocardioides sp. T2.26MG-1 TaxID=3041166 RepID=UPI002541F327|nr:molybdopterin-dependent oxidoreductase [Nocardioides sp. T2.26MG-1]
MSTSRAWSVAGLVAGFAGLAVSYGLAMVMTIRDSPLVAVAELVVRLTPGPVVEFVIKFFGSGDKAFLLVVLVVLSAAIFAWTGRLARRTRWAPVIVYGLLAVLGGVAVWVQRSATALDALPVAAGLATWLVCLSLLTEPLRRHERATTTEPGDVSGPARTGHTRRTFLVRAGGMTAAAAVLGVVGRAVGSGRRHVEETRRLLRLPGVTRPVPPKDSRVDVPEMTPWMTPTDDFYRIDTAFVVPAIEPDDWLLRIHGMVDREIVVTYQDLVDGATTEAWVTLNCVSNEVGGDLIGNAWWSGVRIAGLLRAAGVHTGADAVLQTSEDGWTCGTPLSVLTDDRDAMLAVAMNGEPLPIEHGFPVRTVVPGLYGYVSACKWVVDMKVTRFADIEAYWTEKGWSELGPVKISSRIDVPRGGGEVAAGGAQVAGVAWAQHTGIDAVEISVDGDAWTPARLAGVPSTDTWVQWVAAVDLAPGDHTLSVRARDADGLVQTGEVQDVLPDGATGWHTIDLTAVEPGQTQEEDG